MSRAEEIWRLSGRPDALTNRVFCIPSSCAFSDISAANRDSDPPRCSATATAMSLADFTAMACRASSMLMLSPARSPSFVGDCAAACGETVIMSVEWILPEASASKARYMVMILVIDAG